MGWYKTCGICKKEGKYGLDCDCYDKASDVLLASVAGRRMVGQKFASNQFAKYLYQRFDGICLAICLTGGEYSSDQIVTEISEAEYDNPDTSLLQ